MKISTPSDDPCLIDTSILVRLMEPGSPFFIPAQAALNRFRSNQVRLHIVPQNLIEFYSVATRPENVNGLGMTGSEALDKLRQLERLFILLHDPPGIYEAWKTLITALKVEGKQVHDARIVAAMKVHGLTRLMTYNTTHFRRFPALEVMDPRDV